MCIFITDRSKAVLFVDLFFVVVLCLSLPSAMFVFVALWSPVGKGLTSWLSCV